MYIIKVDLKTCISTTSDDFVYVNDNFKEINLITGRKNVYKKRIIGISEIGGSL